MTKNVLAIVAAPAMPISLVVIAPDLQIEYSANFFFEDLAPQIKMINERYEFKRVSIIGLPAYVKKIEEIVAGIVDVPIETKASKEED